jgi:hypothetical protein
MAIKAYLIEDPSHEVPEEELKELGVFHRVLDADTYEKENKLESLDQICQERGYNYRDFVSQMINLLHYLIRSERNYLSIVGIQRFV